MERTHAFSVPRLSHLTPKSDGGKDPVSMSSMVLQEPDEAWHSRAERIWLHE